MTDQIPTPRTEALFFRVDSTCLGLRVVNAGFARELERENIKFKEALVKLRDCDWTITLPDRMDAVRDIAREALKATES
jgi:hypothetical protein